MFKLPKLILITMAVGAFWASGWVYAQGESEYRQSVDEIGQQINQISRNLNANKALIKTQQDKLFSIERKLSELQKQLLETNNSLSEKQRDIEQLGLQLDEAKTSQKQNRVAFSVLLKSRYKHGNQDFLKRFLNQENPYAVGRLNNYHEYFSAALKEKYREVQAQIAVTREIYAQQQKEISELAMELERQTQLQTQWQSSKQERESTIASLNKKVGDSQGKLDKLKQDRARLNKLIQQIAKQKEALKRLEAERAAQRERDRAREAEKGKTSSRPVVRTPVQGGFRKQKGRLKYPVSGTAKTRFGKRLAESGMRSEGVFFSTDGPAQVKSIFRGRVLFADFLKGYGLLIIIDHGDDHISLYGHNELLYKRVGDTVDTNETIAKSGVTGGLKSPGLYFEIRNNATPVDPASWCQ